MHKLVLNQYREGSGYKDVVGETYHFPNRYLRWFEELPCAFIYYEPREGGEQVYFGAGVVAAVNDDTEESGHSYADILNYAPFDVPLSFYEGPKESTWEPAKTMRNSVRRIDDSLYSQLLGEASFETSSFSREQIASPKLYETRLQEQFESLRQMSLKNPVVLRKLRRVVEAYERPSWITNAVKRQRGDKCQLCGCQGFVKRDGTRYCEVHHLFHLSNTPPSECLAPEYLVVLCATCHRRMHYADVGIPERTATGWKVQIDADTVFLQFPMEASHESPQPLRNRYDPSKGYADVR